ncbi:MAG: nucleotidyltransferase [Georgfuchsia sp.]
MPRYNSSAHSSSSGKSLARRSVANLAARMMAEDGIADYGFAKRKAAKALGVGDGETLPTNEEIEAELRAYQSLFQEDEQPRRLRELREIALEVMSLLSDFRPYLTGAVLDGTAGRYAGIEIDLFADSTKDVEISLLSRDISYESNEPRRQGPDTPETRLHLDWKGFPVTLSIYLLACERQQRRVSPDRPTRARASAVAALIAQT